MYDVTSCAWSHVPSRGGSASRRGSGGKTLLPEPQKEEVCILLEFFLASFYFSGFFFFFGKFGKIVGSRPLLCGILDPPLYFNFSRKNCLLISSQLCTLVSKFLEVKYSIIGQIP